MADLNALIAQGVQFKEPPNPFAQYAQMQQLQQGAQQNQMNQLLMQEKQRGFQEQNSLRSLMAQPGFNLSNPEHQRAVQTVAPNLADTLIKNHLANVEMQGKITAQPGEQAFKAAQTSKFTAETTELANKTKREGLKQAISDISKFDNAADALKDLDVHEREGKIPPEKAAQMRAVLSDPNLSFSKWQRSTVMGLMDEKDRVEATRPKPVATQLGDRVVYQDMNPDSPTFKQEILPNQKMGAAPSTEAAMMQARAAQQQAGTSAGRLKVEQDRLAQDSNAVTYLQNEAGQYNALPSRLAAGAAPVPRPVLTAEGVPLKAKLTPFAEKQAAAKVQLQKDLGFAITELSDAIKEGGLIDQSTGSGAGRLADISMGFVGKATPGAIAIGKLQPIADLPLKLVTRFEGPQSNADTKSYKEASAQLADPTLPRAIRKAAGATVVRLMKERQGQFVTNDMAPTVENAAKGNWGTAEVVKQ